jgi:hypothetical protein
MRQSYERLAARTSAHGGIRTGTGGDDSSYLSMRRAVPVTDTVGS